MILQALNDYYELKAQEDDSKIPVRGWSEAKVVWEFQLDMAGGLNSVITYANQEQRIKYRLLNVPEQPVRSSGIRPFFLCDKAAYFLGRDAKRGPKMLEACRALHHEILDGVDDAGARAVLAFLDEQHGTDNLGDERLAELDKGGLIVFKVFPEWASDGILVHEIPAVRDAWQRHLQDVDETEAVQDSVTGEWGKPATLFPQVAGFPGANSAGASLVSYNKDSFCSYGKTKKDQARNASIIEATAFNVGAALKYLNQSDEHHVALGDTRVLYWTDADDSKGDDLLSLFMDCDQARRNAREDTKKLGEIEERIEAVKKGLPSPEYSKDTNYHILGVSPNAARLSIRFYETGTMGDLEQAYRSYLEDIDIVAPNGMGTMKSHSIRFYVNQTAAFGDSKNVPNVLLCSVVESMVRNRPFPDALYRGLLQRTRNDKGYSGSDNNKYDAVGYRAAMLKACLRRKPRSQDSDDLGGSLAVALDKENKNIGYLLGRLFAVLEKVQIEAIWGSARKASDGSTIRDKYMSSASTTPGLVFPSLMAHAQHHISKSEYGWIADNEIREITDDIDGGAGFPKTLSYEDQGLFYIGYYQEKASFFAHPSNGDDANDAATDEGQE